MANNYIPINLSLENRRCLVIGGGNVALRKIENLLDYYCDITVIASNPLDKIVYFADKNKLKLEKRDYISPESSDYGIVISASDNKDVNEQVSKDCKSRGVPVNVVDNPSLCDFIFPAVVKRDSLSIAISTDGNAPFLSGQLRLILEDIFPQRWKKIISCATSYRRKVLDRWKGEPEKKAICYEKFIQADWKTILKDKTPDEIEKELDMMAEGEYENKE